MFHKMLQFLKNIVRRSETDTVKIGCNLCYDSGVVRFTMGNRHFIEGELYHKCPSGCKLTHYGKSKLSSGN